MAILAGGTGTRFWPASRDILQKPFLPINGSEPLVYETYRRLAPLVGSEFPLFRRKDKKLN